MKAVTEKYPQIIPHHYSPSNDELVANFEDFFHQQDVPIAASSPFSQYFLMRLAKQEGVTVTLDGQGADEYLIGYMHSFYRILADDIRGLRMGKAVSQYKGHAALREFSSSMAIEFWKKTMASVLMPEQRLAELAFKRAQPWVMRRDFKADEPEVPGAHTRTDNFLHGLTFHSTLPTLMHYADRNSMRFSIESRVPFLDHRLVEAGFAMRTEDRVKAGITKRILRDAMQGIIPDAIYNRQDKKAFNTPGEVQWLRGPMAHMLDFSEVTYDLVDHKKVKVLLNEFKAGGNRNAKMVWRLAMLNKWLSS
jgi:asparagine synthase (glutamine-hydrolysing)